MDQSAHSRVRKQTVQHLRLKLFLLLGLWALPVFGALSMLIGHVSAVPALLYSVMSVLTFFLYWRDKFQAQNAQWRMPEKVLHGAELLGGWPGGLIAQQIFRHKTRKLSYQIIFWLIVLLHQLFWFDRLLLGGRFLARHLY
ncbi:DUF1294 domain-containing protein [Pseudomonas sp. 10B1]|uniref:DUF1294 domain-containing protein n=1 Tax=unclassified Pseudomonas TaxID=196821 RepID=UPI002AB59033|nr:MULTISPECIES: DUF1294 domain-containing protein [unclassified Pseudomonas]MDY7560312.1 DUF1294 domain-containing protein [Pseudomonas sp. AB6]MEA9975573.1 DUF1294 domain-containing protein [Pseudomonas sp. RTS4]MEA9993942.1 DUF1294 domain-containing protein [Pseudomonas sp. AA4]MEB0085378.1 DUF1294 domain-containing protein [Pseudomonas sp. RTI1]MEB0124440.1 DUF1294 domain-containing protein [Pseudomonas sp. CCC1.2]